MIASHPHGIAAPILSPRERGVLELAAIGLTAKEIAERLHIAARTVEHHSKRACERLGATNVTHAVAIAIGLGLIRP